MTSKRDKNRGAKGDSLTKEQLEYIAETVKTDREKDRLRKAMEYKPTAINSKLNDNIITRHDWIQGKMIHTAICFKCGSEREIEVDSRSHFIIPPCQKCADRRKFQ